jgi:hypothetical protein
MAPLAAAGVLCAAAAAGAEPAESAAATAQAARARGIAWLLEHQNPDGSWGTFESARPFNIYLGSTASHRAFRDASSAIAMMALIAPAAEDPAVAAALDRAAGYFIEHSPVQRATVDVTYNTWTHTYIVQALARLLQTNRLPARTDALRARLELELERLLAGRQSDGGWGYYTYALRLGGGIARDRTTSFNTASALLALREAREAGLTIEPGVLRDAVRLLAALRLPNGAYAYDAGALLRAGHPVNLPQGSLGRSQPCNLALYHHDAGVSRADLEAGLRRMREEHRFLRIARGRPIPHEAYYSNAGYYYYYGHFHAAEVIRVLPPDARAPWRAWLDAVLAADQNPDGSWFDFPIYGYGRAYATGFAVLALEPDAAAPASIPTPR